MTGDATGSPHFAARGPTNRGVGWIELMVPSFDELREHRPVAQPLLVGWVLALCTAWLTAPLVSVALAGQPGAAEPIIRGWMWAMAAVAPLIQSGRALLWVGATWALLTLAARDSSPRVLLSVFLVGEVLTAAYGLLLALFFHWTVDPGATGTTFLDPLSLAAFVPSSHGAFGGLAKNLSVIQGGWVIYVGLAGRRVLGLGTRGAVVLASTLWVGMVAVSTARILVNG